MSAYATIRKAMRRNEVNLLAHMRQQGGLEYLSLLGSWRGAFERLQDAGMIVYRKRGFRYQARKGARPVTAAVR